VLLIRQPSNHLVREFIASQSDRPFSYSEVGATAAVPPDGYKVDHNRIKLGAGKATFQTAVAALRAWEQFNLGWVGIVPSNAPIEVGTTVAVQASVLGVWSLNACRIVYLLDEKDTELKAHFGFAYGTLPDHAERGEERFSIEWHGDDSVWYDIYAFSRPQNPLVKLSFPYARRLQRRFARESLAKMKAVTETTKSHETFV